MGENRKFAPRCIYRPLLSTFYTAGFSFLLVIALLACSRFTPGNVVNSTSSIANIPNAKGDGINDDTAALQAAIDSAAAGSTLAIPVPAVKYLIKKALSVNKSLIIRGNSQAVEIFQSQSAQPGIVVNSSGVSIENLTLRGPGLPSEGYTVGSNGVEIKGANANSFIARIRLSKVNLFDWGFNGVWAEFIEDFLILDSKVENVAYSGVSVLSGQRGEILRSTIRSVRGANANENFNGYGVTLSKGLGTEAEKPVSRDILVANNIIDSVRTWEGLDTHGGIDITFRDNKITNCRYGIVGTTARDITGYVFAPQNLIIENNSISRDGSLQNRGPAIQAGASYATHPIEGLSIIGNTIDGYGESAGPPTDQGAIVVYIASEVQIRSNTILNSGAAAIYGFTHLMNFLIAENIIGGTSFIDGASLAAIEIGGESNAGSVLNNIKIVTGNSDFGVGVRVTAGSLGSVITPSDGFQ